MQTTCIDSLIHLQLAKNLQGMSFNEPMNMHVLILMTE